MNERSLRLRADGLDWQQLDDEIVVLDLRSSSYLAVNQTGSAVWAALARGATRSELVQRLVERFAVGADEAAADLDGFLALLREKQLLLEDP